MIHTCLQSLVINPHSSLMMPSRAMATAWSTIISDLGMKVKPKSLMILLLSKRGVTSTVYLVYATGLHQNSIQKKQWSDFMFHLGSCAFT